ncbi:MAG TPA: hypothetical protein VIJ18_02980 [Microbacteriaceae bacterium]
MSKGINLLVDLGVLYKKRGIGMFVAPGARDTLRRRRLNEFQDKYVEPLLTEARVLGIDTETLQHLISEKVKDRA